MRDKKTVLGYKGYITDGDGKQVEFDWGQTFDLVVGPKPFS